MTPRDRFRDWAARTAPRQRALAAFAALIVAGAVLWAFVLEPVARDLATTEAVLRDAHASLAQARAHADELAALNRSASPIANANVQTDVERLLGEHGLRSAVTALQAKDDRVEVTFEAIDFAALSALVDAMGRKARLFPVDALVVARTDSGSVRAEIVFARPGTR